VSRPHVYPLWMLAAVGLALWREDAHVCVAAGVGALASQVYAARAWRTSQGKLALANLLTLLRLAIVATLPFLASHIARAAFIAIVIGLLVLDGIDGWIARTRNETSTFGASLDMETDALTTMVLCLLLHREGTFGAWVLVPGLWRYVYATAIAFVPALGDCPPSPIYRWIFCGLMIALAGAFLPWPPIARVSAAAGTIAVSFSFLHSIARSRAFRARS